MASSLHMALVTDAWYPQVNGVVTSYAAIIPILEKQGYSVSVIHPGLFRTIAMPLYPEIRLALFPRRRLRNMLQKIRPDIVHFVAPGALGLAGRAICRKEKIPYTTCYHTHLAHYIDVRFSVFFALVYAFLRWFHNGGALTMVATESLRKELSERGFRNLVPWPLGVDTDLFKRNPEPSLPPMPRPVFVLFGRLAPEKSPEEFFQLHLPGTKLVIGDGPDRAKLEKKYGKTARFIGYKHGQELVDWLSVCDVCVFPSRTETFGLTILESLACGVPVAAHRVQGPQDIITEGTDGHLSENLTEAAEKCLSLSRDMCRKKALQYSWQASADEFIKHQTRARLSLTSSSALQQNAQ